MITKRKTALYHSMKKKLKKKECRSYKETYSPMPVLKALEEEEIFRLMGKGYSKKKDIFVSAWKRK